MPLLVATAAILKCRHWRQKSRTDHHRVFMYLLLSSSFYLNYFPVAVKPKRRRYVKERKVKKEITYHRVVGWVHWIRWLRQVKGCISTVWRLNTVATCPRISRTGSCDIAICEKKKKKQRIQSVMCHPIVACPNIRDLNNRCVQKYTQL